MPDGARSGRGVGPGRRCAAHATLPCRDMAPPRRSGGPGASRSPHAPVSPARPAGTAWSTRHRAATGSPRPGGRRAAGGHGGEEATEPSLPAHDRQTDRRRTDPSPARPRSHRGSTSRGRSSTSANQGSTSRDRSSTSRDHGSTSRGNGSTSAWLACRRVPGFVCYGNLPHPTTTLTCAYALPAALDDAIASGYSPRVRFTVATTRTNPLTPTQHRNRTTPQHRSPEHPAAPGRRSHRVARPHGVLPTSRRVPRCPLPIPDPPRVRPPRRDRAHAHRGGGVALAPPPAARRRHRLPRRRRRRARHRQRPRGAPPRRTARDQEGRQARRRGPRRHHRRPAHRLESQEARRRHRRPGPRPRHPGDGAARLVRYDARSTAAANGGTVLAPKDAGAKGRWHTLHTGTGDFRWFGLFGPDTPADDALDALVNDPSITRIEAHTDLNFTRRHTYTRSTSSSTSAGTRSRRRASSATPTTTRSGRSCSSRAA